MRHWWGILGILSLTGCAPPDPSATCKTPASFERKYVPCRGGCVPKSVDCPEAGPCETLLYPDELLDIALRNNPQTKQSWHFARAAAYNLGAAKSALYPTLTGSETVTAQANHGGGTVVSGGTGSTDTVVSSGALGRRRGGSDVPFITSEITLSYLLFDLGGRCAQIEAARQALLVADWTHNRTIQNVMIAVLQGYYGYLNAQGLLEAREKDLHDSKTNLDAAEAQFAMGVTTRVDVLQARSNYVNAQLQVETARGQVNTTMGQLATALGWPANRQVCVQPLPEELPLDAISENICTLLEVAKVERPDLTAAYNNYLQAEANVVVAESASKPTVSLNADAQRSDFINRPKLRSSQQSAAVAVNFPIFSGWLYENQIASAKETAEAAYAAWKNQEESVLLNVVTSYYAYTTAVEAVKFSDEFLRFSQEAYEAALLGYRLGTNSWLDVLTAQLSLSAARTQWIQARTQFLTSIANVSYAIGTL